MSDFKFQVPEEGYNVLTLQEAIGQAVGAASVCWVDFAFHGGHLEFDSGRASKIVEELEKFVIGNGLQPGNLMASQRLDEMMDRYQTAINNQKRMINLLQMELNGARKEIEVLRFDNQSETDKRADMEGGEG